MSGLMVSTPPCQPTNRPALPKTPLRTTLPSAPEVPVFRGVAPKRVQTRAGLATPVATQSTAKRIGVEAALFWAGQGSLPESPAPYLWPAVQRALPHAPDSHRRRALRLATEIVTELRAVLGRDDLVSLAELRSVMGRRRWSQVVRTLAHGGRVSGPLSEVLKSEAFQLGTQDERAEIVAHFANHHRGPMAGTRLRPWLTSFLSARRSPTQRTHMGDAGPVAAHEFPMVEEALPATRRTVVVGGHPIVVTAPDPIPDNARSVDGLVAGLALVPPEAVRLIKRVDISPGYLSRGSAHPGGQVTVYAARRGYHRFGMRLSNGDGGFGKRVMALMLTHEAGHLLEFLTDARLGEGSALALWRNAMAKDGVSSTPYGKSDVSEDLAEVFMIFMISKGTRFERRARRRFKHRVEALEKMLAEVPLR